MSNPFEYFGKYLLLEKLATGGMAEVFLARATGAGGIGKFVAIKRILPQYAEAEEFIEMFKDEAKIAINLSHSNIVSLHEFGTQNNQFFIVMDYVEGRNLRQILNKVKKGNAKLGIDQIVFVIREVAAGLDHAHRSINGTTGKPLNITHRDMSPQNVMISFEGEVKVVDFGIAKAEIQLETTRTGTLKGKFGYMSPEQAEGQKVDPRTDIFSLGIILWELLANDRLFLANNEINTLRKIRDCQIPSLKKINPNIPNELERITQKALARDRNLRYQNAAAFYRDLNRFLNRQYPDFSSHDFAVFIKTLFADEILNTRKRLVDYSQIQIHGSTSGDGKSKLQSSSLDDEALRGTQTSSLLTSSSMTSSEFSKSSDALKDTSSIPSLSLNFKDKSPNENTFTESNIDFTLSQSDEMEDDKTVPSYSTQHLVDSEPSKAASQASSPASGPDDEQQDTSGTGKTVLDHNALSQSLLHKIDQIKPSTQGLGTPILRSAGNILAPKGKATTSKAKSPKQGGFSLGQLVALALAAVTIYTLAAHLAPAPMQPIVAQLDTYIRPFHEIMGISDRSDLSVKAPEEPSIPTTPPSAEPKAPREPKPGLEAREFVINSSPSGADILINGTPTGLATPAKVSVPPKGEFTVTLRRVGYVDYESTHQLLPGEPTSLNATLQPAVIAFLDIDVRPPVNVRLYINGVELVGERLPIRRRSVPANTDLEIVAVNTITQRQSRQTVKVGQNQHHSVILDLRTSDSRQPSGQ